MIRNPEGNRLAKPIYLNVKLIFGNGVKPTEPTFLIQYFALKNHLFVAGIEDFEGCAVFSPRADKTFGFAQIVTCLIDQGGVLGEGEQADQEKNQGMNCTHWVKKAPVKHCRVLPGT